MKKRYFAAGSESVKGSERTVAQGMNFTETEKVPPQ